MNTNQNILQNITTLPKFQPMSPKQIHLVNCLMKYDKIAELIQLVKEKREFVIETKYDNIAESAELIQILFGHKLKLHIILVETQYLPKSDLYLYGQIMSLFSIVLSPSNEIRSWNDIKTELKFFEPCSLFSSSQIEKIHAISIQHEFQVWFRKTFNNIKLNNVPSDDWTLEKAVAFSLQQYIDTSVSKSLDWDIGLFAKFDTYCTEKSFSEPCAIKLIKENELRKILTEYAVYECMAVNHIAALVLNGWTRKYGENELKKYYNYS